MFTVSEIGALAEALVSNTVSILSGILGLVFTMISIYWKNPPVKRIFLIFGIGALLLSPIYAWRDEYRGRQSDHRTWQNAREGARQEISALSAKIEKLENQEAIKARRRSIRERLGGFIFLAEELKNNTVTKTQEPPPQDDALKWAGQVRQYLIQNLDASYDLRFNSPPTITITQIGVPPEHDALWRWLETRTIRLNEFITELKD